jgi:uncharacterized protein (DUF2252 family)
MIAKWGPKVDAGTMTRARRAARKSQRRTSTRAFNRYSAVGPDGKLHPISQPPLVVPLEQLFTGEMLDVAQRVVQASMRSYLESLAPDKRHLVEGYEMVAVARKVVGVGSVGTRCWIVLMTAVDDSMDDLVLQVKEAGPSVLEPFIAPSEYKNGGRRVVEGQRLMQAASDALLGWETNPGVDGRMHDFYVRQMWDGKVSADLTTMTADQMRLYAEMCGWTLARAHARSGNRKEIAGYLGTGRVFADALVTFAESYADQNDSDYRAVQQAAADGVIEVAQG